MSPRRSIRRHPHLRVLALSDGDVKLSSTMERNLRLLGRHSEAATLEHFGPPELALNATEGEALERRGLVRLRFRVADGRYHASLTELGRQAYSVMTSPHRERESA